MLNPKVVGIVEVPETLNTLEDESGLQLKVRTKNLADVLKEEVTEDRVMSRISQSIKYVNKNLFAMVYILSLLGPNILATVVRRIETQFHSFSTGPILRSCYKMMKWRRSSLHCHDNIETLVMRCQL